MKGSSSMLQISHSRDHERGAVSIFIVVFCALLMTVLTISFIRLMMQEQQQAATNDLSQSAYDSAQAGVEDAKRALLLCQRGDASACTALDSGTCDSIPAALSGAVSTDGDTGNKEVKIQTNAGDDKLNQAYTCVKVTRQTDDYSTPLNKGASKMIPLKVAPGDTFDTIELSWFEYKDFANAGTPGRDIELPTAVNAKLVPSSTNTWPKNRPSLMRAQLLQFDAAAGFTLDSLNAEASGKSNVNTLFLYPTDTVSSNNFNFLDDKRQAQDSGAAGRIDTVKCADTVNVLRYACTASLHLPEPIDGSAKDRTAYLRLSALYNAANYSIRLYKGASLVKFDGVLPKVDSTGRANDIFRRVESRLEVNPIDFPYPEASVDITGNLCKNFVVTDGTGSVNQGYQPSRSCTP